MEQQLTEAARRALRQAEELAKQTRAEAVEPVHLLQALLQEESRAAEILAVYDIGESTLNVLAAQHSKEADNSDAESSAEETETALRQSETLRMVVIEARGRVAMVSRQAEVGSEHLLWGLFRVASPVSELLRIHGVKQEDLAETVQHQAGHETGPLSVDFTLKSSEKSNSELTDTYRILDAAANRCREGLRVLEDYTRFVLDDAHLSGLLKTIRHQLAAALRYLDANGLITARETQQDVGTSISTAAEMLRSSPKAVIEANLKRVQESLRTLEEYSKILSPDCSVRCEQLRYHSYTLEKALLSTLHNRDRLQGRQLYLLATESLCHHGIGPAIKGALAGGVSIVQLREKSLHDRALVELGLRVREWTREAGALLILNDRPDLAVLCEADGVHVGQEELSVKQARRIVGADRLIGVSTHSIEQARQAVRDGADYIGVGPTFESGTKSFTEFAGLNFVQQVAAEIQLPWFAIGGITAKNLPEVIQAGATRVAISGSICRAENPQAAAEELRDLLPKLGQSATDP